MAGYMQVRPSSPSTEKSENPSEERVDVPRNKNVKDEQRERLLGVKPGEVELEDPEYEPRATRRSAWWRMGLFTLATLASSLALLLLIKISFFDSFVKSQPPADETATPKTFRRPSSDYVLDAGWDFNAPPTVREYNWVIRTIEGNPDGVFRTMTTINGQFPGELIRCNEGDTIVVNVDNQSVNATALHWHGIFQNGTNHMDGTPGVTQCPIAPGRKFRYEFTVTGQAGTYFYHGHQAAEALDGLVGPLIVHSRDEGKHQQIPYLTDRVVMVQDWYHDLSSGLLMQSLSPGSESSPVPNGALINGAGVVDCSLRPNRRCDNSTAQLPVFDLAPEANHRLRFLNVGGFAWFQVTLDRHHSLPITEIDGVDIEPSPETSILIGPGQRYSVVLTTNQTGAATDDAFWMRARMVTHCFAENVLPEKGMAVAKAVIRYTSPTGTGATTMIKKEEGDKEETKNKELAPLPMTDDDSGDYVVTCKDMHTRHYAPVPPRPAPTYADHSYYFRVNLEIGDWRLERGFINRSSFRPDLQSPSLHRVVDGLRAGNESFGVAGAVNGRAFDPATELVIGHAGPEVVDVILQNFDEGNHPFHLHGHQLFVLGAGHGYFPGYEALGLAPEGKGLLDGPDRVGASGSGVTDNPTRRDVATVEGFGWTLVRFVADNPGLWIFHCHMAWHGDAGMAMQFLSRLDLLQSSGGWDIPQQNRDLCAASAEDLRKGTPPPDSFWFGNTG